MQSNPPKEALERALSENLSRNTCVCYDVPKGEIIDAVRGGASTLDDVMNQTYAGQGSGCCHRQIERLIEQVQAYDVHIKELSETAQKEGDES